MSHSIIGFKKTNVGYFPRKFHMPRGMLSAGITTSQTYSVANQTFAATAGSVNNSASLGSQVFNQYFGVTWGYSAGGQSHPELLNFNNETFVNTTSLALRSTVQGSASFSTSITAYTTAVSVSSYSVNVDKVNMAARTTSAGTSMSTGRSLAGGSNTADYGIVMNGFTGASTRTFTSEILRFSNDTWSAGGNTAEALDGSASATSADMIYFAGGSNGTNIRTAVSRYQFITGTWDGSVTALLVSRRLPWMAGFYGNAYVLHGTGDTTTTPAGTYRTTGETVSTINHAVSQLTTSLSSANQVGSTAIQTDFGYHNAMMTDYTDFRWLPLGTAITGGTGTHMELNLANMAKSSLGSSNFPTSNVPLYYSGRYGAYVAGGDSGTPSFSSVSSINRYNFSTKANSVHPSSLASAPRYNGYVGGDRVDNVYFIGGVTGGSAVSTTDKIDANFTNKTTPAVLSTAAAWGTAVSFPDRLILMFGNGTGITTNSSQKIYHYFASGISESIGAGVSRVNSRSTSNNVRGFVFETYNTSTPVTSTRHLLAANGAEATGVTLSAANEYSVASAGNKAHLIFGNVHQWLSYTDSTVAVSPGSTPGFTSSVASGTPFVTSHPSHLLPYFYSPKTSPTALAGGYGLILGGASIGASTGDETLYATRSFKFSFTKRGLETSQNLGLARVAGGSGGTETFGFTIGGYGPTSTTGSAETTIHEYASETSLAYSSLTYSPKFNAGWSSSVVAGTAGGANGTASIYSTNSEFQLSSMSWTNFTTINSAGAVASANNVFVVSMGGGSAYSASTISSLTTNLQIRNLSSATYSTSSYTGTDRPYSTVYGNAQFLMQVGGYNTTAVLKYFFAGGQVTCTALASYWEKRSSLNNPAYGVSSGGYISTSLVNSTHSYTLASDVTSVESGAVLPHNLVHPFGLSSAPAWVNDASSSTSRINLYEDSGSSQFLPGDANSIQTQTNVSSSFSGRLLTISENSSTGLHQFSYRGFAPASTPMTNRAKFEIVAKSLNGRKVLLHFDAEATAQVAQFTLSSSGTVDSSTGVTATITALPNGYYRLNIVSGGMQSSGTNDWRPWVTLHNSGTSYTGSNTAELEIVHPFLNFSGPNSHYTLAFGGNVTTVTRLLHSSKVFLANAGGIGYNASQDGFAGNLTLAVSHGYNGDSLYQFADSVCSYLGNSGIGAERASLGFMTYAAYFNKQSNTNTVKFNYASMVSSSQSYGYSDFWASPAGVSPARGLFGGTYEAGNYQATVADVTESTFTFTRLGASLSSQRGAMMSGTSSTHAYFSGGRITAGSPTSPLQTTTQKFSRVASTFSSGTALAVRKGCATGSAHGNTGSSQFYFQLGEYEGTGAGSLANNHRQYTFSGETVSLLSTTSSNYYNIATVSTEPGHLTT